VVHENGEHGPSGSPENGERRPSPIRNDSDLLTTEDLDIENAPSTMNVKWLAALLINLNSHIMNAIDRASHLREPLERLAAAALDDAAANMARTWTRRSRAIAIVSLAALLLGATVLLWEGLATRSYYAGRFPALTRATVPNEYADLTFTLGGVRYETTRHAFQARLRNIEPDRIQKYFVEIDGRRLPAKQAVSVGLGAPRASFDSGKAIAVLLKLGFATQEMQP
jgi:hypothetical protein